MLSQMCRTLEQIRELFILCNEHVLPHISVLWVRGQVTQPFSVIEHGHITAVLGKQLHSKHQLALTQQWLPHTEERDCKSTAPRKAVALVSWSFWSGWTDLLNNWSLNSVVCSTSHLHFILPDAIPVPVGGYRTQVVWMESPVQDWHWKLEAKLRKVAAYPLSPHIYPLSVVLF